MAKNTRYFTGLNKPYRSKTLTRRTLAKDPLKQFERWFERAARKAPFEPHTMVLSTVKDNQPFSRVVLLKKLDQRGFGFFTNYESAKADQIESSSKASLLFYWPWMHWQVRIEGRIKRMSARESDQYFATRPLRSQVGAIISKQSKELHSKKAFDMAVREMERQTKSQSKALKRPKHWGGYILAPKRFEFWQGGQNRLHDRFEYKLRAGHWKIIRLYP